MKDLWELEYYLDTHKGPLSDADLVKFFRAYQSFQERERAKLHDLCQQAKRQSRVSLMDKGTKFPNAVSEISRQCSFVIELTRKSSEFLYEMYLRGLIALPLTVNDQSTPLENA